MKKLIIGMVGGVALSFAGLCLADASSVAATAATGSIKIGVVDAQKVLADSSQAAAARAALEKQFKPQQDKINAEQTQLQADMDKLNKNGAVMRATDKQKLQTQITTERNQLANDQQQLQQSLMNAQYQAMQDLINQLRSVIGQVAKKDNLNVVLPANGVAYADSTVMDITADVETAFKASSANTSK